MKPSDLQTTFTTHVLPAVRQHAQIATRHVKCPQTRDDAIQEATALAWKWVVRLAERGIDPVSLQSSIATFASRAVSSGRRLVRQEAAKDVLSRSAQRKHSFTTSKLPDFEMLGANAVSEALADDSQTPVPDQVAFRLDFPAWLSSLPERNRRILLDLAHGAGTGEVADKHGLSPARVSQLRRQFADSWAFYQAA